MKLSLIAAMAKNRCIGKGNKLPWDIPEDMKYFLDTTRGHAVLMGRKTFESMGGRPMPKRENLVLTRDPDFNPSGVTRFRSLDDALHVLKTQEKYKDQEVFVIGGGEVYRQSVPFADRIYLTVIEKEFEGDAYFPEFDRAEFKEVSRKDSSHEGIEFSFLVFEKSSETGP